MAREGRGSRSSRRHQQPRVLRLQRNFGHDPELAPCPGVLPAGDRLGLLSGGGEHARNVLIQFPSYEKAIDWYNSEELKPVKKLRLDNSTSNSIIIKGV